MKFQMIKSLALAAGLMVCVGIGLATAAAQSATPPAAPADPAKLRADKTDLGAAAPAAPAAEAVTIKKTEIANYDFWHLQCDQFSDPKIGKRCAARMPVFKSGGQQLLAVLVIAQDESAKNWVLKVVIPTSISVQDGASIAFEGAKAQNFPIETCEPQACSSSLPMDAAMTAQLKASNKVTLTWTTIDHNPIKFDFEIKGVQQTMKALFG